MRAKAAAGMDLAGVAESFDGAESDFGTDAGWIGSGPNQSHAYSRRTGSIAIESNGAVMLADRQIRAAVAVIVRHGAASLFPIERDARFGGAQRLKPAVSVAKQDQAQPGVLSGAFGIHSEEILRQE